MRRIENEDVKHGIRIWTIQRLNEVKIELEYLPSGFASITLVVFILEI